MENREGYKKTELGWIPEEWDSFRLDKSGIEIIDGDRGVNYPKQDEFFHNGFCLFLNAKNVTKAGFKFDETQYISKSKDKLLSKGKLQRDDIVITTRGTVGNIAWFNNDIQFNEIRINSGMALIRQHKRNYDSLYLYNFLRSDVFQKQVKLISFGSAQPQLTIKEIKLFNIITPPLPEQQKIASILTTVDDKISSIEAQIQQTEQLKKGLMAKLLTEGIGHTEFKDTEIGRIPKGWEVVKFGTITNLGKSKVNPKDSANCQCIELEHIEQKTGRLLGYSFTDDKTSIKTTFKSGDI
ncbi:MAG: restriction endonuclease subunit S [Desulfamplus sp.]|nr:restriction endonuclease subunit S [Desulfamplus sp.]